jgi:hypothetical protein
MRTPGISSGYDDRCSQDDCLHFLEADCRYYAAFCPQSINDALDGVRHKDERDGIMQRLAKVVPDGFDDAMELLRFATERLKTIDRISRIGSETLIIEMLKNVRTAAYNAHVKMRTDFILRSFNEMGAA